MTQDHKQQTQFHHDGLPSTIDLTEEGFKSWWVQDLMDNTTRGGVGEYLVASVLGAAKSQEWAPYDLQTAEGIRIEVKTSGLRQSWHEEGSPDSVPSWDISPKLAWNREQNIRGEVRIRSSDLYVFCLHRGEAPRNLNEWTFLVLPTQVLNSARPYQKTIRHGPLKELGAVEIGFSGLRQAVEDTMSSGEGLPTFRPLSGHEQLHENGVPLATGTTVLDFWSWSASNLVENLRRAEFGQFLVMTALEAWGHTHDSWISNEIETASGVRVAVKTAGLRQSWNLQSAPDSKPLFNIAPSGQLVEETGRYGEKRKRFSDVHVFCLYRKGEPMDIANWDFYVLPTRVLEAKAPDQKTAVLSRLVRLGARQVAFGDLRATIERECRSGNR